MLARIPRGTYCSFKAVRSIKMGIRQHNINTVGRGLFLHCMLFCSDQEDLPSRFVDQQCILTSNAGYQVLYSRCNTCLEYAAFFMIDTNSLLGCFSPKSWTFFRTHHLQSIANFDRYLIVLQDICENYDCANYWVFHQNVVAKKSVLGDLSVLLL